MQDDDKKLAEDTAEDRKVWLDEDAKWFIFHKDAKEFVSTLRGQYIISQALAIAIDRLEEVDPPMREESNISDMKFLRNYLFHLHLPAKELEEITEAVKIKLGKENNGKS